MASVPDARGPVVKAIHLAAAAADRLNGGSSGGANTATMDSWVSVTEQEAAAAAAALAEAPATPRPAKPQTSYDYDTLLRVNRTQETLGRAGDRLREAQLQVERVLEAGLALKLKRSLSQSRLRVQYLRQELDLRRQTLETERRAALNTRRKLEDSRKKLSAADETCTIARSFLEDNLKKLEDSRSSLKDTQLRIKFLQASIAEHIALIYPISPILPGSNGWRILGVLLPNSEFTGAEPDHDLSTALGYVAHLTLLIATYLEVPLRYPLRPLGSRSTVSDPVSVMQGPTHYPLYLKGADKLRLKYGVFLLNKNIEQLLNHEGITIMDLRKTLPNLSLLLTCIAEGRNYPRV